MTDPNPDPSAEDFPSGDETTKLFESISQVGSDTKYLLRKERQLTRIQKSLGKLGLFDAFRSADAEDSWVSIDAETNEIAFSGIPPERFAVFAIQLEEIVAALDSSFLPKAAPDSSQKQLALSPIIPGSVPNPHLGGRV